MNNIETFKGYITDKVGYFYTINSQLPTLNEYIDIERSNKFAAATMKKNATHNCTVAALTASSIRTYYNDIIVEQHKSKFLNRRYDVLLLWTFANMRKDPDNVFFGVKFILDGAVKSGKLSNDGCNNIGSITNRWQLGVEWSVAVLFY